MKVIFEETQKFNQWWLWLIIIAVAGGITYTPFQQGSSMSSLAYGISIVFIVLVVIFFVLLKLDTQIDDKGISFKFFPLTKKVYQWDEIKEAKIIDYGFVGGWGIRLGTKYGTIYNVRGKIGLQIVLHSGKKIVVGTQKYKELNATLKAIKSIN